jgi:hypothetical protein
MMNGLPAIDHDRRSLSIPRQLMPTVLAVHAGTRPPTAAAAALRAGGIMADTSLDPLVTALVEVMTNPSLVVTAELSRASGAVLRKPRLTTFWSNGSRAVIGHTDDRRRFQLMQVARALLPFHMAQAVEVAPRPTPQFAGSFSVPAHALNKIEGAVSTNPARAEADLLAAGVKPEWTERLVAALLMRRSLWTIESVWLGDTAGRDESQISVLDSGFAGFWRLATATDGNVTVTPTTFDDLLRRLAALLPDSY